MTNNIEGHNASTTVAQKLPNNWYFGSKPPSYGQRNEQMKKMWREFLLAERDKKRTEANKLNDKLG